MKAKRHLTSIMLTFFVISILLFLGPAEAIGVNIDNLEDIDYSDFSTEDFEIVVTVNDGEFLPIDYTNLVFSDGTNEFTCRINPDNTNDCSFLTVNSVDISNLNGGYGYGYGYGYDSSGNEGYQDFGYGYGYGYEGASGPGTITYSLTIDASKLPGFFVEKTVDVEAVVYGGTSSNYAYFKGSTDFYFTATEVETTVVPGSPATVTYGDVILEIPNVPEGVTLITTQLVPPTVEPEVGNVILFGKVFSFGPSGTIFDPAITITLPYTDEELSVAGVNENDIHASYYDGTSWIVIETTVDPDANTITFTITHFTEFAVTNVNREILCDETGGDWILDGTRERCDCSDITPGKWKWLYPEGCKVWIQEADPIYLPSPIEIGTSGPGGGSYIPRETLIEEETLVEEEVIEEETTEGTIEETIADEATPNNGLFGITGAAIMDGLFGTNTSTALTVVGLIVILGLLFYFVFYKKKRIKKKN